MKVIRVEESIGRRLAHDYTCIDQGFKGAIKKRGDIVRQEDVELLRKCGHYYVLVLEDKEENSDYIHEEEAVLGLAKIISGRNIVTKPVQEAKVFLYSNVKGLLIVDSNRLLQLNSTGSFIVITKKSGSYVNKGDLVGVVDLIPLFIRREEYDKIVDEIVGRSPVIHVHETKRPRVGVIITGSEIVDGVKKDMASPVITEKLSRYDCIKGDVKYVRDDLSLIVEAIESMLINHQAVLVTGGMSVDPTDYTPKAIRMVADEVIAYGIPIKPTTMSMIAYKGDKAIIGVSSGIIYFPEENILDILLPWISAGVKIPREYILSLGEGGLMESFLRKMSK